MQIIVISDEFGTWGFPQFCQNWQNLAIRISPSSKILEVQLFLTVGMGFHCSYVPSGTLEGTLVGMMFWCTTYQGTCGLLAFNTGTVFFSYKHYTNCIVFSLVISLPRTFMISCWVLKVRNSPFTIHKWLILQQLGPVNQVLLCSIDFAEITSANLLIITTRNN